MLQVVVPLKSILYLVDGQKDKFTETFEEWFNEKTIKRGVDDYFEDMMGSQWMTSKTLQEDMSLFQVDSVLGKAKVTDIWEDPLEFREFLDPDKSFTFKLRRPTGDTKELTIRAIPELR